MRASSFVSSNGGLTGFSPSSALLQTVRELLENALDARASAVRLGVAANGGAAGGGARAAAALVSVEDDGCGIPRGAVGSLLGRVFASTKSSAAVAAATAASPSPSTSSTSSSSSSSSSRTLPRAVR